MKRIDRRFWHHNIYADNVYLIEQAIFINLYMYPCPAEVFK